MSERLPFVSLNFDDNKNLALEKIKSMNLFWSKEEVEDFVDRHGAQAYIFIKNNLEKSYIALEAAIAIEEYCCGTLVDFYFRRTPWSLSRKHLTNKDIYEVGSVFREKLKWSDQFFKQQIEQLQQSLKS